MAVVSGNPAEAAPFTVEFSFPDGYRIPPHFHPTDETVEVKKGTFLVGMGVARGATVVSVTAMGPFAMTYVNTAEDPRIAALWRVRPGR